MSVNAPKQIEVNVMYKSLKRFISSIRYVAVLSNLYKQYIFSVLFLKYFLLYFYL